MDQFDGFSRDDGRPRTADRQGFFHSLDVNIPHCNLGSPRFSPNGTPFLYGTSSLHLQSTAAEICSSLASQHSNSRWLWQGNDPHSLSAGISASISSTLSPRGPQLTRSKMSLQGLASTITSVPLIPSPPVPASHAPLNICPEIYDHLSHPPGLDDPSIVRYDAQSRDIVAAIPARIIAQITSSTFVDYHLLSDFFLTFRLFMNSSDLASHLMSRLKWAIARDDDTGKIIRVRTFVAIRHWLLNYFPDDFVPSLVFRQEFARAMNDLTKVVKAKKNPSDLKIIGELKKCWRRTCALYWDIAVATDASVDDDISPGGPPGTREATLSRTQSSRLRLPQLLTPPPRLDIIRSEQSSGTDSFIRDVVQPRLAMFERKGGDSEIQNNTTQRSKSHSTVCSRSNASGRMELAVGSNTVHRKPSSSEGSAISSEGMLRGRCHKRSGSFSDALRDIRHPFPIQTSVAKTTQLFMALPYAGSLVRGNIFGPTPAYVEVIAPSTPVTEFVGPIAQVKTSNSVPATKSPEKHLTVPNKSTSGPGMKRLFGSVRKALGGKSPPMYPKLGNSISDSSLRISRTQSTPSNKSVLEAMKANVWRTGMGMSGEGQLARIDLLGAGAIDAFQRAIMGGYSTPNQGMAGRTLSEGAGPVAQREPGIPVVGVMDGTFDRGTDMPVVLGSVMTGPADISTECEDLGLGEPELIDFLDSPPISGLSTISLSHPDDSEHIITSEKSFLVDSSGPSIKSWNSISSDNPEGVTSRIPSQLPTSDGRSLTMRRSKSFPFEVSPLRFERRIENTDKNSLNTYPGGMDVRSLHSARSYSLIRDDTCSQSMDNISEFSEATTSKTAESRHYPRGMLRRRPGGNLRVAVTIGELEQPRPMSTGSLGASVRSLDELHTPNHHTQLRQRGTSPLQTSLVTSAPQTIAAGVVSLGAMGKSGCTPESSPAIAELLEQPTGLDGCSESLEDVDIKQSFEAGVQLLRDLPDDLSDDGGVEVALAKLEGTYQRKKSGDTTPMFDFQQSTTSRDFEPSVAIEEEEQGIFNFDGPGDDNREGNYGLLKSRYNQKLDRVSQKSASRTNGSSFCEIHDRGSIASTQETQDNPMPTLRRRVTADVGDSARLGHLPYSSSPAVNLYRVDSKLEMHVGKNSAILEGDDNVSELSSELSFEIPNQRNTAGNGFPPISPGTIISELGIPSHPLRHPPSPPVIPKPALSTVLVTSSSADRTESTPTAKYKPWSTVENDAISSHSHQSTFTATPSNYRESEILQPTAMHLPFILAYDSELLAKQFTLIEKDALLEIDWKELVELSWGQSDTDVKDWVELLNSRDIKGVEVVIARFNLVCNSENYYIKRRC
jgi:hypothetical protein